MKNIILTSALLILGFIAYSQAYTSENSSVMFAKATTGIKATDCIGDWTSFDGHHLTLYGNNKAVWKDEGHIYYMTWHTDEQSTNGNIKICLAGTDICKHKSFYLGETENGMEIVEDQNNVHMHFTKETVATLQ